MAHDRTVHAAPAEPAGEMMELTCGGELSLVPTADGAYRMTVDAEGVHLSVPLSSGDVENARFMFGMTAARARAVRPIL